MVFLDGLGAACDLTSALIERIPKALYDEDPDLVAEYTNGLTAERRDYNMELFQKGTCRILVCTEACGMGVDISNVERVIQWGVTSRVNLSTIIQRMGRAARKSHMQGIGILFHTAQSVITPKHVMGAQKYLRGAEQPEYLEVQKEIMRYDLGLLGLEQQKRGNMSSGHELRNIKRRRAKKSKADVLSISGQEQNINIIQENPGGLTGQIKDFPSHCRATLSLINTSGCRRRVILTYFGELTPINQMEMNPNCCDHCLEANWCPELLRLIPPNPPSQQAAVVHEPNSTVLRPVAKTKVPPALRQDIVQAIKVKRREIWNSVGGNKRISPYPAGTLMTEKDISLLGMKSISIKTPEDVPKTLGLHSYKYISSPHHQLWDSTFDIISTILREPSSSYSDTLLSADSTNPPHNPPPNQPTIGNPLASTPLQEINPSTNNMRIATHTSAGKARKLTKAGLPRKVRCDFGKPKKRKADEEAPII